MGYLTTLLVTYGVVGVLCTGGNYSFVPNDKCVSPLKLCYQGSEEAILRVQKSDPIDPCGGKKSDVRQGNCSQFGYDGRHFVDPVFTDCTVWKKNGTQSVTTPYAHQTGSPSVNIFASNCWTNVTFNATGRRALIVTTSHGKRLSNGMKSGLCLEEAAEPYYVYLDAGMTVDIVSIAGGKVPYDTLPESTGVKRFLKDTVAMGKLENSSSVSTSDFTNYDVVFMAGGWGAAFDLGYSVDLGKRVAAALLAGQPMVASTCHGALGFVQANKTDGTPWVKGRLVTGVSDRQIKELGITTQTPMHPETVLRELGADYQCIHGTGLLGDIGAESVSVDLTLKAPLVTGQNQCASCIVAQRQLQFLLSK